MAFKSNLFNSIKLSRPKRNTFDLSHDVKLSFDMGQLVPIMVQECLPGDSYQLSCDSLLRFAPLVAPVMHRMDVTMHYFFVPNRLLWKDWGKWITGEADIMHPYIEYDSTMYGNHPLLDYMGLPELTGDEGDFRQINAFPFAAYQMIYNEYYRDQNLITPISFELEAGSNQLLVENLLPLRLRAWQHDYFTAALPFAQKGPAVDIPITQGTVVLDSEATMPGRIRHAVGHAGIPTSDLGTDVIGGLIGKGTPSNPAVYDPQGTLITENEPTTINDLRRAFRLQEWLEKNARGGTRYVESILSHFGVRSSDARLQRPEYITGTKSPVIISEVLNTTGEDGGLPQGNMAGHGVSVTTGKYGKYYCEEHGWIIGIMSVMPLPAYQQGIARHFLRADRFDYFWPEFANIGEQEVLAQEIYANSADPFRTFGYVPRYAEYKYTPSRVAGDFKTSLDFWHLGRIFENEPFLNKSFIECDPGKRIFAVTGPENSLYAQVLNKVVAKRLMPRFGNPSF